MFELEIDEKQMNELETFFSTSPEVIEKALKFARKKAGAKVRKLQREASEKKYVNSKKTLNNQTHKVKNNAKETLITAFSKRSHLDNFYVSMSKPAPNKNKLKVKVLKNRSPTTLDTTFWAFFKDRKHNIGLWERVGKEREKIAPIRTVSPYAMGKTSDHYDLLIEDEIQTVFFDALEEAIYKEL